MIDLVEHINKEKNIFFDTINKNKEKRENEKNEEIKSN